MLHRRSGRPLNSFPVYYYCPAQRVHTDSRLKLLRELARNGEVKCMSISSFSFLSGGYLASPINSVNPELFQGVVQTIMRRSRRSQACDMESRSVQSRFQDDIEMERTTLEKCASSEMGGREWLERVN